jgi:integrase/recombinase XerD
MSPLRQRFLEEMKLRNYSPRTVEAYLAALVKLSRYSNRSLDRLDTEEIRVFQLHLIAQDVSWSTFNQIACALRFFYSQVLKRTIEHVPFVRFAKKPKSLPSILSPGEVKHLLDAERDPAKRTMFRTAYACGLRIEELLHLKVTDIDSERMLLWVRSGKGNKDRCVPICTTLLEELRTHWKYHRSRIYLFVNSQGEPWCAGTIQRAFQIARERSGLTKPATPHTLRHCFATHRLEGGMDLATLQRLMGHSDLSTTLRYLHLRSAHLRQYGSLLELIDGEGSPNTRTRPSGPPIPSRVSA